LKNDGTVVTWGVNFAGQTTVPAGLSGVTAIAAGVAHTVALKSDGTVVAWGDNSRGQTAVPAGLSGVTAIAAGFYHTVALVAATTPQDTTAPVLTLPSSGTVEAAGPSGTVITFSASASDAVDGAVVVILSPASGSTFPLGTTTVTAGATDAAGNTATGSFTVTVRDTTAPVLLLPSSGTVEAAGPNGAAVMFSASASDIVSGTVAVTLNPPSGSTFPLGTTTVNASATDAAGNTATGSFTVTVRDTTAPVITSLAASPAVLWPPNHKMVSVNVAGQAQEAVSEVTGRILSVTSNEPDNGLGDGDTGGDIVITGAGTVSLRAERAANGTGRIYTILFEAKDATGNASTKTVTVSVPKNQGK
ncbi:MAG: HYR domain-containing protein, partial [Limisphaerales bacterium]